MRSQRDAHEHDVAAADHHGHAHQGGGHGHSHGLVDPSIVRSREGVKAVSISLVVLLATTVIQVGVFVFTNSMALLADLIHTFGDALTALPLGSAFFLRSARLLRRRSDLRQCLRCALADGRAPDQGAIGFIGNEIAA